LFRGEGVWLDFFIKNLLLLKGHGAEVNVFFFFHLTYGRRRGGGLISFKFFFFIVEWLGKGGGCSFSFDLLKGDGRGRGLTSFYKFIEGGGGHKVGLRVLILAKIN
jgi:hypothetical protein